MNSLKNREIPRVSLLNFEGGPWIPLLNFEGGHEVPRSLWGGSRPEGPEIPGSWSHFYTMPKKNRISTNKKQAE